MRTKLTVWAGAILLVLCGSAIAWSAAPEFEVASIKPTKSSSGVVGGCHGSDSHFRLDDPRGSVPLGRCVITAGRLSHIMAIAYDLDVNRIEGRPDWENPMRFDVEAKAENANATEAQLLQMLRTLLEDRFKLKMHREQRQVPGFVLVVGKNGPKGLREAQSDEESKLVVRGATINKADAIDKASGGDKKNTNLNTLIGTKATMAQLAEILSRAARGPVVDRTGLKGEYDFTLTWELDESPASVVQEQLGLRLDAQKVPVDFITIDSAEKPTENE